MGKNCSKITKEENNELLRGNRNNKYNYNLRVKEYILIILFRDYYKTVSFKSLFKAIIFSYIYNNGCVRIMRRILNEKRAEQRLLGGLVR